MAQLPVLLRPKYLIRRKAMRSGLLGPSRLWRSVAFVIIFSNALRRFFGSRPEPLGVRTIAAGSLISVAASKPLSRRQAQRAGITKSALAAAASADLEAAQRAS